MSRRASTANLALSIVAFLVFMGVLVQAVAGFGVGIAEVVVWVAVVTAGVCALVVRHSRARRRT